MANEVTKQPKTAKVKMSDVFKGRLAVADKEAEKLTKSNAALAKTIRARLYQQAEVDLKGQRIGTKNGETEMIIFPDKSAVLAALVAGAFSNVTLTGKFLRP